MDVSSFAAELHPENVDAVDAADVPSYKHLRGYSRPHDCSCLHVDDKHAVLLLLHSDWNEDVADVPNYNLLHGYNRLHDCNCLYVDIINNTKLYNSE